MTRIKFIAPAILLFAVSLYARADSPDTSKPLIFGLLPSESTVAKFKRYAPLRDYLANNLQRKVILETARDFPEFVQRTKNRRYDFLETAPHFVPAAIDSGSYHVITTISQPLSAQIVVLKAGTIRTIDQLSNRIIATPSPKAIITKIGRKMIDTELSKKKLALPQYTTYKTHNAAYEAVIGNKADAAIISVNIFNKALTKGEPLKSIGTSEHIPNMSILVAADLPAELRDQLQNQLVNMDKTPTGVEVLKKIAYPGYRPAKSVEFNKLRHYLK